MPDNTILQAVSAAGDTLRTLEDAGAIKWPASVVCYATTIGTPDVLQIVTSANPLPVTSELNTADMDTGAGTDLQVVVGLLSAESGGSVVVGSTNPLPVDLGLNNDIQGAVAQGEPVAANPFLQAAEARNTEPTAVSNGDVARLMSDLVGKLVVQPYAPSDLFLNGQTDHNGTLSNQQLFGSAGPGLKNYLTDISISNTSETDTEVVIKSGTGEKWRLPAPHKAGAIHGFQTPVFTDANTAMNIATVNLVSAVKVSATGYVGR